MVAGAAVAAIDVSLGTGKAATLASGGDIRLLMPVVASGWVIVAYSGDGGAALRGGAVADD
jgi:hypothetical protein